MYDYPHRFGPFLPTYKAAALLDKAGGIVHSAIALRSVAHPSSRDVIREHVRSINACNNIRVEGLAIHPTDVDKAIHQQFSDRPDVAQRQRIVLAHLDAERELEQQMDAGRSPIASAFLVAVHQALFSRLAPADRTTQGGRVIEPGLLRTENVQVGKHVPPDGGQLPMFLRRMDDVYGKEQGWERKLIAIACCHHRAVWVHPFLEGAGRAIRLQTHMALGPLSGGLWTPSRGIGLVPQDYLVKLTNAHALKRGVLDGRGMLTAIGLTAWVDFFLDICKDQVDFMTRMLNLDGMKRRIEALVNYRAAHDKEMRTEAILPLCHLFAAGPVSRGEFVQLTGLGERTARNLLARLLATRLVISDSPRGSVRFGLPLDALYLLFPELYPEANILSSEG